MEGIHFKISLSLLLTAVIFSNTKSQTVPATSPVWQWSVTVDAPPSGETNAQPEAWLWIPENCKKVRGVVFAQNNMIEEGILEHTVFRENMRDLGLAEVWVTPVMVQKFDFHADDPVLFRNMMQKLADESGYAELATAPVIPVGHSAAATFPWNFAAWDPARTLAVISIHGDAPQTNLTGYGGKNIEWGERNIDGVPALFIMGEYEWWEDRLTPGLKYQQQHPGSVITWFADAGHGHFDYSDELIDYICLYLTKAVKYRLPGMKPLRPENGWLMDRWRRDSLPTAASAPYASFSGDRATASWIFDKQMAEATEAFYETARNKKEQHIGIMQNGNVVEPGSSHANYQLKLIPLKSGITFNVKAFFADSTRKTPVRHHARTPLFIDRITGPVKKINDSTFDIHFGKLGFNNSKRSNIIWLIAHNAGDDEYKSAVQQMEVRFPVFNREGKPQVITFPTIEDQVAGVKSLPLQAGSDAGTPVQYYVKAGPAFIRDNQLIFTPLPPKTKFPVKVTVVAWQYGVAGVLQSAEPVQREFLIRKK